MKIDGLPIGNNLIGKIDGTQKSADAGTVKRKAVAAEHGAEVEHDRLEVAGFVVEAEFEPRTGLLESVTERLESDGYHDAEVNTTIAERLVAADASETVLSAVSVDTTVSSGYYNAEEVVRTIAERIAPVVGLDTLTGNVSE